MSVAAEPRRQRPLWRRILRWLGLPPPLERWLRRRLPRRLFARSLLIIILPMLILQSVVAFVFLDRHWENMTTRLSVATATEIAALVDILETAPDERGAELVAVAGARLFTEVTLLETDHLPLPGPKPFFSLLDRTLSRLISVEVNRPFWIDTLGSSRFVEVQVKTHAGILRIVTRRSHTYASDAHITLVWMAGTSLVLIAVAILFLKGQVRPIQELAAAAERFGQGRPIGPLRPHGAIEVRQAGWAFLEMRQRIERQIEQRTQMLAGVSHDLRTMLTRFRLELAVLPEGEDVDALTEDVDQMQAMLEDYLTFARTDVDEPVADVSIEPLIASAVRGFDNVRVVVPQDIAAHIRPNATLRLVANLVSNAVAYAPNVEVGATSDGNRLFITVDDDGPGMPPDEYEAAFRPFYRLDNARNQDRGGTGLGLTIARDIALRQGGNVTLSKSPLGGLRARVRLPQ
ncbi:ATP-binding protein [Acuticoccus sp. MNP-M23]|uniref:ATP-binding protein n=1 Tax=Acuticoccus sp. MNP-M23 TaxID=3072793 RepID=UPI002814C0FE|nr:ATP-binding protein [Acuticoccus sp. MNP-M23]WMS43679.1 ATP-binding protein [Acuticoccus sp. MNP-M23]